MSDKETKERIEKEAEVFAVENYFDEVRCIARFGYITGSETERSKARNKAIDECMSVIREVIPNKHKDRINIFLKLEQLKHKQP